MLGNPPSRGQRGPLPGIVEPHLIGIARQGVAVCPLKPAVAIRRMADQTIRNIVLGNVFRQDDQPGMPGRIDPLN